MISWRRLAVLVLGLGSGAVFASAESLKAELLRLTEQADTLRITVVNTVDAPHRAEKILSGRERVAAFLASVEFERDVAPVAAPTAKAKTKTETEADGGFIIPETNCRCTGQFALSFRRADQELLGLTLHHAAHVRSVQFNHGADAFLTERSRRALSVFTATGAALPPAPAK